MKFSVAASLLLFPSMMDAYQVSLPTSITASKMSSSWRSTTTPPQYSRQSQLKMSDFDFPSAMPEKPQQSVEEKLQQSADDFITSMTAALGDDVEAPPELEELKKLRENDSTEASTLALKIYELMIERGMRYDENTDGSLTPTQFVIQDNLDVKEVQDEFGYLYKYGMMLLSKGLLTEEQVKTTVVDRLIARTGKTPEEFDAWLGY
mmetsp:Transcript_27316/g.78659  ORF Transcript_27316/g.78659 Transcript_27316/m.78659 type:complete len:206 (-) Transcript_27316:217-834(-)|eukprot:CAMPEP_0176025866 /NCGR_PEP_ID=MMETSP0120_2-20121206/12662_1 /TAXON_ID=160619 /ORGANISM="Kryptoperidinium foliaceum, Strain CCMP 1326" /LENGTH=205 /DNA_ID=CAMNT_0017359057 /DNA_START=90 /DNA_END=707 /DNA_ORIENTATION=-